MFAHRKAITRTKSALSETNGNFMLGFSVYLKFFRGSCASKYSRPILWTVKAKVTS